MPEEVIYKIMCVLIDILKFSSLAYLGLILFISLFNLVCHILGGEKNE